MDITVEVYKTSASKESLRDEDYGWAKRDHLSAIEALFPDDEILGWHTASELHQKLNRAIDMAEAAMRVAHCIQNTVCWYDEEPVWIDFR